MNKNKQLRALILRFRLKIANDFKIERTPVQIFKYFRGTLNDENKIGIKARICEVINICLKDDICYRRIAAELAFLGKQLEDLNCGHFKKGE